MIELTEEGTEAAAATAMVANYCCLMEEEEEEVEFTADQPFIMVVGGELLLDSVWETVVIFKGRFSRK